VDYSQCGIKYLQITSNKGIDLEYIKNSYLIRDESPIKMRNKLENCILVNTVKNEENGICLGEILQQIKKSAFIPNFSAVL
jgi:hypothetical protein